MKRFSILLFSLALLLSFAACGNQAAPTSTAEEFFGEPSPPVAAASAEPAPEAEELASNILIAYFTMPEDVDTTGVDAVASASIVVHDGEVLGSNQFVAELIQSAIGGDLFEIRTEQQYPLDHEPLVDQADEEQAENARPALSVLLEHPEQYDTILLGFPKLYPTDRACI